MLRDSTVAVATSNTAAHDNNEKINSWALFPSMVMGLRLAALRAAGAPLLMIPYVNQNLDVITYTCR